METGAVVDDWEFLNRHGGRGGSERKDEKNELINTQRKKQHLDGRSQLRRGCWTEPRQTGNSVTVSSISSQGAAAERWGYAKGTTPVWLPQQSADNTRPALSLYYWKLDPVWGGWGNWHILAASWKYRCAKSAHYTVWHIVEWRVKRRKWGQTEKWGPAVSDAVIWCPARWTSLTLPGLYFLPDLSCLPFRWHFTNLYEGGDKGGGGMMGLDHWKDIGMG